VQLDRPGNTETIGPWSANSFGGKAGRTQLADGAEGGAEGYIALLGPAKTEDSAAYKLHAGIIRLRLRSEGNEAVASLAGAELRPGPPKDPREVLARPPEVGKTSAKVVTVQQVDESRARPGEELLLLDTWLQPKEEEWTRIRLWVRFYTAQELASGAQ
jgi:hypothetical protein